MADPILATLFAVGAVIEAIERHWWFSLMATCVAAWMFFLILQ